MPRMSKTEARNRRAAARANSRAVRGAAESNANKTPAQLRRTINQAMRTYNAQIQNGATPGQARRAFNSYGLSFKQVRDYEKATGRDLNLTYNSKGTKIVSSSDSSET